MKRKTVVALSTATALLNLTFFPTPIVDVVGNPDSFGEILMAVTFLVPAAIAITAFAGGVAAGMSADFMDSH